MMKGATPKFNPAALALALTAFAACNEEALSDPVCGDENTFEFNGADYCVVIEEGFLETECPSDFPSGRSFEDFVLCATGDPVPDAAADEARRRGFGIPDDTCTDGETRPAGDGCNTCTCVDGEYSACTEIACDPLDLCLADCAACEPPDVASYVGESPEECSVIDYACEPGENSFSNECGCGCAPNAAPICEEGAVIDAADGCNTCTCTDGTFVCTELTCEPTLEECLAACGDGCPAPEFQLCSVDGENFCNSCEASCYEASISTDREPCECPVLAGELVTFELITIADGCVETNTESVESAVARDRGDVLDWFSCPTGVDPLSFDPAAEVIVRAVFPQNSAATVREVVRTDDGTIIVNMVAPRHCSGPFPPDQIVFIRIPFPDADTTIGVANCRHTRCTELFP
jgi:hypothetical protein